MAKKGRSLNRRRPRRRERNRLLIVTEGQNTEVQYFEGLVQHLRAAGTVRGVGKDPKHVLRAALDMQDQEPDGFDEVWLVVDVDEHATLDDALVEAKRCGIPVAVSNPCFEIWLVWHYQDCSSHQATKKLAEKLKKHGHVGKDIPNSFPFEAHDEAARRAGSAVAPWERGPNPSSGMPQLIAALKRRPRVGDR